MTIDIIINSYFNVFGGIDFIYQICAIAISFSIVYGLLDYVLD